jgi:hypothetical protein
MFRLARTAVGYKFSLVVISGAVAAALGNLLAGHPRVDFLASGVVVWWTVLSVVGVVNILGWRVSAAVLAHRRITADPSLHSMQQWQLLLSSIFVLGCGFRSLVPRADVQRIGLIDSWMSSVLVGRSVATVAELCLVAQLAILLHHVSREAQCRLGMAVSWLVVPLIAVAEICSWEAILTTCYLGNVIEESIWALTASLLLIGCVALWSRCRRPWRPLVRAAVLLGAAYVLFMVTVDIPMYVARWQADDAAGRAYLSVSQGLQDAWSRRVVTFDWEAWRAEIPWMSLYFSVAVWCSLALVHAPWFDWEAARLPRRLLQQPVGDS